MKNMKCRSLSLFMVSLFNTQKGHAIVEEVILIKRRILMRVRAFEKKQLILLLPVTIQPRLSLLSSPPSFHDCTPHSIEK